MPPSSRRWLALALLLSAAAVAVDPALCASRPAERPVGKEAMPGTEWFPGARLNVVDQVFRHATAGRAAILAGNEAGALDEVSLRALERRDMTLYADEFRCPLPAGVIARALWELVDRQQPGLYHLGGRERLSRWEIGEALLPWSPELDGHLIKGSARNHVGSPRPADLSAAPLRQAPAPPVVPHSGVS